MGIGIRLYLTGFDMCLLYLVLWFQSTFLAALHATILTSSFYYTFLLASWPTRLHQQNSAHAATAPVAGSGHGVMILIHRQEGM